MLGAIIGDMAGSVYEHHNHKSKDFPFFSDRSSPTDDSIMTIAVAKAIIACQGDMSYLHTQAIKWMQKIGVQYPNCGFGRRFREWIRTENPRPYYSYGNGSAMRISPVAWAAKDLEECIDMSRTVSEVSHNHPEGIKGAEAIAVSTFLAIHGSSKKEIRKYVSEHYYLLDFTLDEIRPTYSFDVSCQGSVPQAIEAFLESTDFEDAIRNAISIGGDSDSIAACTGAIAEAYYGIPADLRKKAVKQFLYAWEGRYGFAFAWKHPDLLAVVDEFESSIAYKK